MLVQIQYLSGLRDLPGPEKTEVSDYAEIQASPMRQRLRPLRQKIDQFLRGVGEALVNASDELEFIGTTMDITGLKRAEEMQIAIAREREMLMQQRAADLAKANEALRSCLDALVSVPELDAFIGQVMAAITQQLGAASSSLGVLKTKQEGMRIELLFQGGLVMSPADGNYPERLQSLSLEEIGFGLLEEPVTVLDLAGPQAPGMHSDLRAYLNGLGVRTLLLIPLFSQGQINGILSFRFAEKRDFQAEELEIARAQPMSIKDSSLLESMRILAERSNIPGRLCCTFRSNLVDDEGLPVVVRQRWLLVVGSWRLAVGSLRLVVGGWPFNDSWSRREVVSRRDE